MKIKALLCKKCKNIIYSVSNYDNRSCDCGSISIDAEGLRSVGDFELMEHLELDGDVLLKLILSQDYNYGCRNIPEEYLDRLHGKFRITEKSNYEFFNKLVIKGDWE